jgi:uncharacterized damage-inducible protein DinB
MDTVAAAFVEKSRNLLLSDYLPKIDRCLSRLETGDVWWRPNDASNSIGNLILHLCGNVTMWIIGGVGRLPFERNRQQEFDERREMPAAALNERLHDIVRRADEVMAGLSESELLSRRDIQGYNVTVLEAVYHVVEHFGMHTGQIILLSKARVGEHLNLWEPPSPSP